MELLDNQSKRVQVGHTGHQNPKTTQNPPNGVGEGWPPLLTKKWLAIHFGCWNGKRISYKQLRRQVLTKSVLSEAGIPEDYAYSVSTRTFNAIYSMKLTQVLRGFCLLSVLLLANAANAQNSKTSDFTLAVPDKVQYAKDTILRDTIPGLAMVTDSLVRMVSTKRPGEYRYEAVLGTVCLEAIMVKEYRYLVRANDGGLDPFDLGQRFFFLTGGQIDPKRIVIFKQYDKPK